VFGANLSQANSSSCTAPDPAVVAAAAALQTAAEHACSKLQLVQVLLSPVPASANFLPAQNICLGPSSFQILYMYVAGVLLLVLPLTCGYCLEYWAKSSWLKSNLIVEAKPPWLVTLPIFATQPCSSSSLEGIRGHSNSPAGQCAQGLWLPVALDVANGCTAACALAVGVCRGVCILYGWCLRACIGWDCLCMDAELVLRPAGW
jgi:hypothetical protein